MNISLTLLATFVMSGRILSSIVNSMSDGFISGFN